MKNIGITSVLCLWILSGCASPKLVMPERSGVPLININSLMGESELYIIYAKDKEGNPTRITTVTTNQTDAIGLFTKRYDYIKTFDCIRLATNASSNDQENVAVCDQNRWFEYGMNNLTKLTTRKAKGVAGTVFGGVVGVGLAPVALLIDALSFDPTLKYSRKNLTESLSDPAQDIEELKRTREAVTILASEEYSTEKKEAMLDVSRALAFSKKYKKDDFTAIIDSNLNNAMQKRSNKDVYTTLTMLPVSSEQTRKGISFLRSVKTFDGFATAFEISKDVNDAKQAQALALSQDDKRKTEYMAIKLYQRGRANNLFNVEYVRALKSSDVKASREMGGMFTFKENVKEGKVNFASGVRIRADKKLADFSYGTYDITVRATLSIPQRFYRRSSWLGNEDRTEVKKFTAEKVFRIKPPSFLADETFSFEDIRMNYKDTGAAGGTTEITTIGDPTIQAEVTNVTLVE